jgi:hypothetical protein
MQAVTNIDMRKHVILHDTAVVSFDAETVILDSGGWHTATTKRKMNEASVEYNLGFRVYQKENQWYLRQPNGNVSRFFDGVEFVRVA